MDRLESLGNTLSQITMYDIKTMYNQAKNVVLNVSEIEAKVREATNDDPWGASSTLMQDIANRTFNYPDFNEIMPSIYSKYMEKEARQWRQIYKALQLLEYLIKHGSERVVDDARAHISTIKMLRNFHYIDDKGKDEGINVRNRSKEIVELLSDVEKIRAERRKAKANKHKYIGTGNDGLSFSSGGSRYGGFGSDSLGGGSYSGSASFSNDYNGSYSGSSGSGFRDDSRRGYEEYNAGDDETVTTSPNRSSSMGSTRAPTRKPTAPLPASEPVAEVDLLGGLDDDAFASAPASQAKTTSTFATDKALPAVSQPNVSIDDDEFADFQAAPSTPASTVATSPTVAPMNAKLNLMEMLNSSPTSSAQAARSTSTNFMPTSVQPQPIGMGIGSSFNMGMSGSGHKPSPSLSTSVSPPLQPQQPKTNLFGGSTVMSPTTAASSFSAVPMRPTPPSMSSTTSVSSTTPKPAPSANFDDLWSMTLGGGLGAKPATPVAAGGGKSMKDLEKEKASAGLWGGATSKPPMGTQSFGSFGSATTPANNASTSGADDLLL
ncbi:uncharacterized protein EV420DRAFT_1534391 [Desarmillaria tabescens]|uniref:ENTH domain-containing protein n=1 Tax=Armillaria tabescens TaxID=1929756 RepID=A0AA39KFU4_ARMTA|nr:uncharacterized protein EV420DRAFT_1534391 [Desarmillaria tabescens]KAK0459998.1 hypothetical protein EV420DRAFT_1534391 [Desarmillaria tabescens]